MTPQPQEGGFTPSSLAQRIHDLRRELHPLDPTTPAASEVLHSLADVIDAMAIVAEGTPAAWIAAHLRSEIDAALRRARR